MKFHRDPNMVNYEGSEDEGQREDLYSMLDQRDASALSPVRLSVRDDNKIWRIGSRVISVVTETTYKACIRRTLTRHTL